MELTAHDLLALFPLGIAMVLAAKVMGGVRTIGTFAPALVALTVIQLGAQATASMLLVAGAAGLVVASIVEHLAVPRSTRLAVLVVVVCAAVVATGTVDEQAVAFPLVVIAIVIERTWDTARTSGAPAALRLSATTIAIGFVVAAGLSALSPWVLGHHWLPTAAAGAAVNLAIGSYRGLRLTELRRFAPVHASPSASSSAIEVRR